MPPAKKGGNRTCTVPKVQGPKDGYYYLVAMLATAPSRPKTRRESWGDASWLEAGFTDRWETKEEALKYVLEYQKYLLGTHPEVHTKKRARSPAVAGSALIGVRSC